VHNTGSPPQLFQPGIPVVVVGHFDSASGSTFLSDQIMVKHSADYIAQHPNRVKASNGSVR
jgi:cytochrome c-type biogenesis protein CcmE